jgi:hypothetical protein
VSVTFHTELKTPIETLKGGITSMSAGRRRISDYYGLTAFDRPMMSGIHLRLIWGKSALARRAHSQAWRRPVGKDSRGSTSGIHRCHIAFDIGGPLRPRRVAESPGDVA